MVKKPIRSGFCSNGHHEGTTPVNYKGDPLPTCVWLPCECDCHAKIDKMFKMAGEPRVGRMPNPKYVREPSPFLPPKQLDLRAGDTRSNGDHPDTLLGPENATHGVLDRVAGRAFALTPTGQRARGQLEYEVLSICKQFNDKVFDWDMCITKYVAEAIDKNDPPSTGAISAVWDRWAAMRFAMIGKKPIRFLGFTNSNGTAEELDAVKSELKRKKARSKADARRGIRS